MLPLRLRRGFAGLANRNADQNNENNDRSSESQSESSLTSKPDPEEGMFFPTLWDVLKVRYILQWKLKKIVPPELVDAIVDAAEYWPSTIHAMEGDRVIRCDRDQVLFKTVPLCFDRKVCRSSLSCDELANPLCYCFLGPRRIKPRIWVS